MATEKPQFEKFMTPRGVALYPHLIKADTKFDSEGVFCVDLAVDAELAAPFIAQLEAVRDAFYKALDAKTKKASTIVDVFTPELDDEGEETGRVIFKAKQKAIIKSGDKVYKKTISLFDASNNKITPESMWSGTELKLAGVIVPYRMASSKTVGVSLRLSAAQILKLVEGNSDSGESYGFGEEEGYKGETFENSAGAGGDDTDGDGGDF